MQNCLLDSGADVSLLPSQLAGTQNLSPFFPLLAVNNTSLTTEGTLSLPVVIEGQQLPATFFVTPNIDEIILRRDWLTNNSVTWDFAAGVISVRNRKIKLRVKAGKLNGCKRCITQTEVTIPSRSEAILSTYVVYSRLEGPQTSSHHWSTALNAPVSGLRVARTLIDHNSGTAGVRVCNITERPITLHRGCIVSPLQPVDTLSQPRADPEAPSSTPTEHIRPILDKVNPTVPTDVRQQLVNLLSSYSDFFSKSEFDLGCTNIIQHRIAHRHTG